MLPSAQTLSPAHCCRRVDAATGNIGTVAGNGTQTYTMGSAGGDGEQGTRAAMGTPVGVAVDGTGNIYIAEVGGSRIRRLNVYTGIIRTLSGYGGGKYYSGGDGSFAQVATVNQPTDMLVLAGGQVVIADTQSHFLRIVNCSATMPPPPANIGQ